MKQLLFILPVLTLIVGCSRNEAERQILTSTSVRNPDVVATMPDGRILYRITVAGITSTYNDYVYYFGSNDTKTISVNYRIPQGKTTINRTIVLDGVTYQAVQTNN